MGIVKLIVVVLVVWLGFSLFKRLRKPTDQISQKSAKQKHKMLACSVCKIHIPEDEAIVQNGKVYCSKEHLE